MPPKSEPLTELGGADVVDGLYRVAVQYRAASGQQMHIHGPRREQRRRAKTDLDQMRAAGAIGTTREQGLQYMAVTRDAGLAELAFRLKGPNVP